MTEPLAVKISDCRKAMESILVEGSVQATFLGDGAEDANFALDVEQMPGGTAFSLGVLVGLRIAELRSLEALVAR